MPWIELAHDCGHDLEAPQPAPRCFKTHCWFGHVPKGAKYIVVVREPKDVVRGASTSKPLPALSFFFFHFFFPLQVVSFFKFFQGWFFQPGEVTLEQFAHEFWLARGIPASNMQNARSARLT